MLKAIHAQEDRKAAQAKAKEVVARLKAMKLKSAAELVEQKVTETGWRLGYSERKAWIGSRQAALRAG